MIFLSLTAIFAFGLPPHFARHFYPEVPPFRLRLIAPGLFLLIALACFSGWALPAWGATVAFGLVVMGPTRGKRHGSAPGA